MTELQFQVHQVDPRTFRLVGELDMATVQTFTAAIDATQADGQMTLDLSELAFIDSHGLHALVKYARALDGRGSLVLTNVPSFALKVFEIVGFDKNAGIELK